ncbi:MAG: NAD(+) synthase [Lachnospiraceae bacterium]|nr:NAD(+) synthase [Lachnospiraceae bacterium]
MIDGFLKAAAITPEIRVADTAFNADVVIKEAKDAVKKGAKLLVFPELCITGYTCSDLFLQDILLKNAREELKRIAEETKKLDALIFVGLPLEEDGKLYNVAAALNKGKVLALIPKTFIPTYGEFYEIRHFASGSNKKGFVDLFGEQVPFGTDVLIKCRNFPKLVVGCEICEDLWVPDPPSTGLVLHGATVIVNPSASNELVCKDAYRKNLVSMTSARLVSGYVYASAGEGESTQDTVYAGHDLICENGEVLAESRLFSTGAVFGDLDLEKIAHDRRRMNTFEVREPDENTVVIFSFDEIEKTSIQRRYARKPFVPGDEETRNARCEQILEIQSRGLEKRLKHINSQNATIGISGGLDSTLALLVTAKAFDILGLSREKILAVTMPCFGTTDRTYNNAVRLTKSIGATLKEVDLKASVTAHFKDIGQDSNVHDITYENGQARERTQVLMDLANKNNGIVVGTGDLSELALGWATYNGDHMSMYAVNVGVPKTLVRHLVRYYADTCGDEETRAVLSDILDTPVSPELLPPTEGNISQKTEDLVGPYELHDFFLYHMLRNGSAPSKIFRLAKLSFAGEYDDETILKWLRTFCRRFFSQQFKRSCLPDGPKVGSVAVSPRGDLRMPSDAVAKLWLDSLNDIQV